MSGGVPTRRQLYEALGPADRRRLDAIVAADNKRERDAAKRYREEWDAFHLLLLKRFSLCMALFGGLFAIFAATAPHTDWAAVFAAIIGIAAAGSTVFAVLFLCAYGNVEF